MQAPRGGSATVLCPPGLLAWPPWGPRVGWAEMPVPVLPFGFVYETGVIKFEFDFSPLFGLLFTKLIVYLSEGFGFNHSD